MNYIPLLKQTIKIILMATNPLMPGGNKKVTYT